MKIMWQIIGIVFCVSVFFFRIEGAVVRGKICSHDCKTVQIEILSDNPIHSHQKILSSLVDSDGKFNLTIPVEFLVFGNIKVGKLVHEICLLPDDDLWIGIEDDVFMYKGKGAAHNLFLYLMDRHGYSDQYFNSHLAMRDQSLEEFASKVADFRNKRGEVLYEFSREHRLDPEFVHFYLIKNRQIYLNLMRDYPERYARSKKINIAQLELGDDYEQCGNLKKLTDDHNLHSYAYVNGLMNYFHYKTNELFNGRWKGNPLEKTDDLIKDLKSLNDKYEHVPRRIILDSLNGKTRECLMASWICRGMAHDKFDSLMFVEFKQTARDSLAILTVDRNYDRYRQKRAMIGRPLSWEFAEIPMIDPQCHDITLGKIIDRHKGKVLYLNIWSIACAPCRADMPKLKSIREKLTGKPVEFITLSVDEITDNLSDLEYPLYWSKAFEMCLTRDNHYAFKQSFNAELLQMLEVNGIPYHLIFDKNGRLVEYDAPGPDEKIIVGNELVSSLEYNLTELMK